MATAEMYDFFIAYASPDKEQAEELCWHLQDKKCDVFLDEQGIPPGATWPTWLSDALSASRATLVLLSSHTDTAFYQQEEIARAIQLSRDKPSQHTVIPILLEKREGDLPYGLQTLQTLDATRPGKLKRVARELAKLREEWDAQPAQPVSQPHLSSGNYRAFGAALRLDRILQWDGVKRAQEDGEHLLFLLHGPRKQNVGLFVERIQHFLSQETNKPHNVVRVRFKLEGVTPRCGADWLRHLRLALGDTGEAKLSLAQAAREHAVFLILGLHPLDRLDGEQQDGLREFIETSLQELLRSARLRNGVRVLLSLDYDDGLPHEAPLVTAAKDWGRNAQDTGVLRFIPLPAVKLPDWDEVELYLAEVKPAPAKDTIAELHAEYERLTSGQELSYQELASMIDRYLQDA